MDERFAELDGLVPLQGMLGYLNFSQGKPDPRFQKQLSDAYRVLADRGAQEPWQILHQALDAKLGALQASGAGAFRDVSQAQAVLSLVFARVLPAYRDHHADLLFHLSDRDLFHPFFLARVCEAVLAQGPPWDEGQRIVAGSLAHLNDFVGHRPIAILETRPKGEPYDHERVRPIPLYLRGAGVAWGRYHDLVTTALEILKGTDPALLADAHFDLELLDEWAIDPRAYDQGHPANRRPNYAFGEWDPHHLDNQGRYRRYVNRWITLDALLDRVDHAEPLDRAEVLFEAAAVLAGTLLMATGLCGSSPTTHDSATTLATLMPRIARNRDTFYADLLQRVGGAHGQRLRQEMATTRQPFGGARQYFNQFLARHRAAQLQQRHLAILFAEMGYPEASRTEAARIPAVSVRLLSEILGRLTTGQLLADCGELAPAARLLPEVEDLLRRGIACGALVDPWNILGFQGLFPLFTAREDSVRDPRVDELLQGVEQTFNLYARLMSEAAAAGEQALVASLSAGLRRLAAWWDRFASAAVSDVRPVHGGEAAASAEHVATALARWHERGEAAADLAFWRQHLEGFRSPKAFALVVAALLHKGDYRAGMALLMNWLGQVEQVPLEEGEHSFHTLALSWMLAVTGSEPADGGAGTGREPRDPAWNLVKKFFDYLEANAEDYWQVPTLELEGPAADDERADQEEDVYRAAYEDVTYRDSTDDDQEGAVLDGGPPHQDFDLELEGQRIDKRLRFLASVARLWHVAATPAFAGWAAPQRPDPDRAETLGQWLATAQQNQQRLLALLDAIHGCPIPEPLGSYDSLVEYDRRRVFKEQLLYTAINTCLVTSLAVGALQGAIQVTAGRDAGDTGPQGDAGWGLLAVRLEQAMARGDAAETRALLPAFLDRFRGEPLLFTGLADGGQPRQILRVRIAQAILRALLSTLPRLGLVRETYHVLQTARAMEQAHPPQGRRVTEFNHLFEAALRAVAETVVAAAAGPAPADNRDLVDLLGQLNGPFQALWIEHGRTLRLSVLETLRGGNDWHSLRQFVQHYGADLFHAKFMTLANLRAILHRGVGNYLDYLRDNADPLEPVALIEDLDRTLARERAEHYLQCILQTVVENYQEYKDYNTSTTQSDYGQNLYILLDFLRLKASYQRHAWLLRPMYLVHEVLADKGRTQAAVLWEEALTRFTEQWAAEHLKELARLEQAHGVRLGTVADHFQERFVKPLALDRLCALVEPAVKEARQAGPGQAFSRFVQELQNYTARPTGVGLDVPAWLRRLELELQRVREAQTTPASLAENLSRPPPIALSFDHFRDQLQDWDRPLA